MMFCDAKSFNRKIRFDERHADIMRWRYGGSGVAWRPPFEWADCRGMFAGAKAFIRRFPEVRSNKSLVTYYAFDDDDTDDDWVRSGDESGSGASNSDSDEIDEGERFV